MNTHNEFHAHLRDVVARGVGAVGLIVSALALAGALIVTSHRRFWLATAAPMLAVVTGFVLSRTTAALIALSAAMTATPRPATVLGWNGDGTPPGRGVPRNQAVGAL